MAKNSLYKKLVRQFESTINNYQAVSSELDFTKFEKIILIQKKDNRYYRDIQQFLVYLREFKDKNELIFIFPESRKKYQCLLEKIESLLIVNPLEKKNRLSAIATTVKKSIINPVVEVSQTLFNMIFFLQLFTQQTVTARPLEASRYTRQTNNCEHPNGNQCNENLDMRVYQDDLQKSSVFFEILNKKQSIEFKFKDTIFILSKNCLSRQSLDKNPQTLCRSDYAWFLESMAIHFIGNKVRAEAQEQDLSQQNDAVFAQITQDICSIDPTQHDNRQLMGIDRLENSHKIALEKFIFNAEYLPNTFKSIFSVGNSSNLISDVKNAVSLKITELKKLEREESNLFASLNRDDYSRALPETQSAISGVLSTDLNTLSSISHQSAEGFNWRILAPVIVVPAIIVPIIVFAIWYRKKFKSGNSEINMELNPLLNSIPDSLQVLQIAGVLTKRLEPLKDLRRYDNEIGVHYISFRSVKPKEEAIEHLKKIKKALTKFLESKRSSNKDKIISNKLKSALLIVDSLIQRYNLLSLPNTIENKHNYLKDYLISGLKILISSMIEGTEIIRNSYKELDKIDELVNCERAAYDANLIAHAEGYFEKYPPEQVINCLQLETTSIKDNHESELNTIKQIQANLLSSLKIIIDSFGKLKDEFLISGKIELSNVANSIIMQSESVKSQLSFHFTDSNARRDEASKLKLTQAQEPIESSKLAFFKQPKSVQINQPAEIYNAGQILKP